MFIPSDSGANAFTVPSASTFTLPASTPPIPREQVRLLLFGTLPAIQSSIRDLHKRGYAEPNDWSRPISTGRANEMMAILTKRVEV